MGSSRFLFSFVLILCIYYCCGNDQPPASPPLPTETLFEQIMRKTQQMQAEEAAPPSTMQPMNPKLVFPEGKKPRNSIPQSVLSWAKQVASFFSIQRLLGRSPVNLDDPRDANLLYFSSILYKSTPLPPETNGLLCSSCWELILTALCLGGHGNTRYRIGIAIAVITRGQEIDFNYYKALTKEMKENTMLIASGMSLGSNIVKTTYGYDRVLKNCFGTEVQQTTSLTKDDIKRFLSKRLGTPVDTEGFVDKGEETGLNLVMGSNLVARWNYKFNVEESFIGDFSTGRKKKKVVYMTQENSFYYLKLPKLNLEVLELPYSVEDGSSFSLIIYLPSSRLKLQDMESYLSNTNWLLNEMEDLSDQTKKTWIRVAIPRFFIVDKKIDDFTTVTNLNTEIKLEYNPNFSVIAHSPGLAVTSIYQHNLFSVTEEGSGKEASMDVIQRTSAYLPGGAIFHANRPFFFVLLHRPRKMVVLQGHVIDPIA